MCHRNLSFSLGFICFPLTASLCSGVMSSLMSGYSASISLVSEFLYLTLSEFSGKLSKLQMSKAHPELLYHDVVKPKFVTCPSKRPMTWGKIIGTREKNVFAKPANRRRWKAVAIKAILCRGHRHTAYLGFGGGVFLVSDWGGHKGVTSSAAVSSPMH